MVRGGARAVPSGARCVAEGRGYAASSAQPAGGRARPHLVHALVTLTLTLSLTLTLTVTVTLTVTLALTLTRCIYGIPQCATSVLKIDPKRQQVSTLGTLPGGGWKWHGGVTGPDGCIYGIPANADTVLKIDPMAQRVLALPLRCTWVGVRVSSP